MSEYQKQYSLIQNPLLLLRRLSKLAIFLIEKDCFFQLNIIIQNHLKQFLLTT